MACLCKSSTQALRLALPQLDVSVSVAADVDLQIQALFAWLAQLGLPAAPWQPDPAWLDLELAVPALNVGAIATLSACAQVRADVQAQLGIDLLVPGQAAGFAQLVASVQARLDAMLAADVTIGVSASAWTQLSATLTATAQVRAALALGLFPSPPSPPSLSTWRPFLIRLRALLPLISLSSQLGIDLSASFAADLSAALRVMLRVPMPSLSPPSLQLMASLTASLSAVANLSASLGVDALSVGLPTIQLMVAERVAITARAIQSALGMSPGALLSLLNSQPRPAYSASLMATPAVVSIAAGINVNALASANWSVPASASLPLVSVGLPTLAFTAQLNAALGASLAVSGCPVCDILGLVGSLF
jgi:hypothetical protein